MLRTLKQVLLALSLNERKTGFKRTGDGIDFLGYRIFYHHLLLRRKNMKKARRRFVRLEGRKYRNYSLTLTHLNSQRRAPSTQRKYVTQDLINTYLLHCPTLLLTLRARIANDICTSDVLYFL